MPKLVERVTVVKFDEQLTNRQPHRISWLEHSVNGKPWQTVPGTLRTNNLLWVTNRMGTIRTFTFTVTNTADVVLWRAAAK